MTNIKQLRDAVTKVQDSGQVAQRLWDTFFIEVSTVSADDRYVHQAKLYAGCNPTAEFTKFDRQTDRERTIEAAQEILSTGFLKADLEALYDSGLLRMPEDE